MKVILAQLNEQIILSKCVCFFLQVPSGLSSRLLLVLETEFITRFIVSNPTKYRIGGLGGGLCSHCFRPVADWCLCPNVRAACCPKRFLSLPSSRAAFTSQMKRGSQFALVQTFVFNRNVCSYCTHMSLIHTLGFTKSVLLH